MTFRLNVLALFLLISSNAALSETLPQLPDPLDLLKDTRLASSWSCSPRQTCKAISSCEEAIWLLHNCSWGGALDRDEDGVPCETICLGG